ncbi:hypothetical protein IGJ55_002128 [Enterococcus sp. AZ170]|uniref:helix-turn-helix domain-containing protein n=1 Tax=unclassified Enterococcus TaxID=2608891 RepID=UPI003D271083
MLYENVKVEAAKKGISIRKIEQELEFSNGSISKWNDSVPSVDKIQKVAKFLGITIEKLLEQKQTA